MAFSADLFRAAHRPWQLTTGGRTFVARHVSAPAVVAFHTRFAEARSETGRMRALRRLLRLAFPWRFSYLVRGDPVRILARMEPAAQRAALADFFVALEGKSPSSTLPTIPGKPSSTRSPTG